MRAAIPSAQATSTGIKTLISIPALLSNRSGKYPGQGIGTVPPVPPEVSPPPVDGVGAMTIGLVTAPPVPPAAPPPPPPVGFAEGGVVGARPFDGLTFAGLPGAPPVKRSVRDSALSQPDSRNIEVKAAAAAPRSRRFGPVMSGFPSISAEPRIRPTRSEMPSLGRTNRNTEKLQSGNLAPPFQCGLK
jgi:hypothetical protein